MPPGTSAVAGDYRTTLNKSGTAKKIHLMTRFGPVSMVPEIPLDRDKLLWEWPTEGFTRKRLWDSHLNPQLLFEGLPMSLCDLVDITWVRHVSNLNYREAFFTSLDYYFHQVVVEGIDGDLEGVRRAAIEAATRKYVVLADADDVYVPSGIQMAIALLEQHPDLDAVSASDHRFVGAAPTTIAAMLPYGLLTKERVLADVTNMHNCVVYRTDLLKAWMRSFKTPENTRNFDWTYKAAFAQDHSVLAIPVLGVCSRIRTDHNSWLTGQWDPNKNIERKSP